MHPHIHITGVFYFSLICLLLLKLKIKKTNIEIFSRGYILFGVFVGVVKVKSKLLVQSTMNCLLDNTLPYFAVFVRNGSVIKCICRIVIVHHCKLKPPKCIHRLTKSIRKRCATNHENWTNNFFGTVVHGIERLNSNL